MITPQASLERRNFVIELVPTKDIEGAYVTILKALKELGYATELVLVDAELEVCIKRNRLRSLDNVSCWYTEGIRFIGCRQRPGWPLRILQRARRNDRAETDTGREGH